MHTHSKGISCACDCPTNLFSKAIQLHTQHTQKIAEQVYVGTII